MKKIKAIVLTILLCSSLTSISTEEKRCTARCYWNDDIGDCFLDAVGAQCLDVEKPNPYSTYIPCRCCIIITPDKK